jgi:hypothetical protein
MISASSSASSGVAATTPEKRLVRSLSKVSGRPNASTTVPPAAGTVTIAAARSMIRCVSDPGSQKASVDPSATSAASSTEVDRIRTRLACPATRNQASVLFRCGRMMFTEAPAAALGPVVRYGVGCPATACQARPVSSQVVSASRASPSTTSAPPNAQSGIPAAAFAEPSIGSITSIAAEPRSRNPSSSLRRFTPNGSVAATMASSTSRSTRMVGVPSAPSATVSASSALVYSRRALP